MAYEEYTDEELMQMAGMKPPTGDALDYTDEELMKIAGGKPPAVEKPGLLSRVGTDIKEAWNEVVKPSTEPTNPKIFGMDPESALRVAGHLGSAAGDIMITGAKKAYEYGVSPETQKSISDVGSYLANTDIGKAQITTLRGVKDVVGALAKKYPRAAEDVEAGLNALNLIPAVQIIKGVGVLTRVYAASKLAPEVLDQAMSNVVTKGIEKGIRPSVESTKTAGMTKQYFNNAKDAVQNIVKNKDSLVLMDEVGEKVMGRLPENLKQFSEAIAQTKGNIFKEYNNMAVKAGKAQATVDLTPISEELNIIAKSKILNDLAPDVAKYAQSRADNIIARGTYTTTEAQEAISVLNNSLGAFYKNPSYETASKAYVDSLVVNNLRKSLDTVIEKTVSPGYQELKKSYGALKTIERDVNRRATVDARKNLKGLLDFSDVFSGAYAVHGIITMNPGVLGAAAAAKATVRLYNWLNNPNRIVKNMFSNAEKILNKGTKPVVIDPTGPVEGLSPEVLWPVRPEDPRMKQKLLRAPYEETLQLPAGQGFTFPDQKLLRAPYETPLQLEGQGFELKGGPFNAENLPAVQKWKGEGFMMRPLEKFDGMSPGQITREIIRKQKKITLREAKRKSRHME